MRLFLRSIQGFAAVYLATVVSHTWAADRSAPAAIATATLGGRQFWADEVFFHQWHIQRNVYTGHCRLLDGDSHRHASGTYEECMAALERIKARDRLPPMRGKAVLLLHGLGRSHAAMDKLANYLREQGGYKVFNVTYPSTRLEIGEHARALKHIVDHLDGIEEINFVGHSMGNVVVRYYLGNQAAPLWPDPRLKRFVMLGPPNHQADLAVLLSDSSVFQMLGLCTRNNNWAATGITWKSGWPRRSASSASSPGAERMATATTRWCPATMTASLAWPAPVWLGQGTSLSCPCCTPG